MWITWCVKRSHVIILILYRRYEFYINNCAPQYHFIIYTILFYFFFIERYKQLHFYTSRVIYMVRRYQGRDTRRMKRRIWKASGIARGVAIPASEAFANKTILLDETVCACVCVPESGVPPATGFQRLRLIETQISLCLSFCLFALLSSRLSIPVAPINFLDESAFRGTGSLLLNAYQSVGNREMSEGRGREGEVGALMRF